MVAERIRVLIADDHAVLCEGLKLYLQRCGMDVVGVASNGKEAVQMSTDLEPDVLLLDIRMPVMDGLQALAEVKAARPGTNVIMLTAYPTQDHVAESFRRGASGFLSKTTEAEHVSAAIQIVAAGDAIVDRELLQGAIQALSVPAAPEYHELDLNQLDLTYQERRVLKLIAAGLENRRIADRLSISHNTIKTHMRNIYSKLGVTGRTQAAIWAMRHGLAD